MKVMVVGGGVIGLSIAWRAAGAGMTVTVVDPAPGRGATGVAAGMLAPVTEVHYGEEAVLALNLESSACYPDFVAELEECSGQPTGYRESGTLSVARDADDLAALDALVAYQRGLGLAVERLRSRELRRLEPALAPVCGVAPWCPVTTRSIPVAWPRPCSRPAGAWGSSSVGVGPPAWDPAGWSWRGRGPLRRCRGGRRRVLVVAPGGPAERRGRRHPSGEGPDPAPAQSGGVDPGQPQRPWPRRLPGGEERRRAGRGATVEERGYDTTVTAGAVHDLLRAALELVPDVAELALVESSAGLRPGTPDNAPVVGATDTEGLVVATGHYRNGILLAPATAAAVVELLGTGEAPPSVAPFSPRRFERVAS